jgi:hypothetical protein
MLDNDVDVNKASTPVICKMRPNEAANKATTGERAPWSPLPAGLTSVVHAHDVEAAAAVGAGRARERWLTTKVSDVACERTVNGNRKMISWRQVKIDQLGFIGRRP